MSTRGVSTRNPARLVVALAVAGALAVFLLYNAVAGHSTPTFTPAELPTHTGSLAVEAQVVGPISGDPHSAAGLRFRLKNISGKSPVVPVVYHGDSPPPLFQVGRAVLVSGTYAGGRLEASSLVTKCPSKYTAKPAT